MGVKISDLPAITAPYTGNEQFLINQAGVTRVDSISSFVNYLSGEINSEINIDLSSPPPIGDVDPSTGTFTTLSANEFSASKITFPSTLGGSDSRFEEDIAFINGSLEVTQDTTLQNDLKVAGEVRVKTSAVKLIITENATSTEFIYEYSENSQYWGFDAANNISFAQGVWTILVNGTVIATSEEPVSSPDLVGTWVYVISATLITVESVDTRISSEGIDCRGDLEVSGETALRGQVLVDQANLSVDGALYLGGDLFANNSLTVGGLATLPHIHGSIAGNFYIHVRNTSGGTLTRGTPVYITGNVGATERVTVAAADNTNPAKMPAVGLLEQTLSDYQDGDAIILGELNQANTAELSINQEVYVGQNNLAYTKPTTGAIQPVGVVSRVHTSTGVIVVNMHGRSDLGIVEDPALFFNQDNPPTNGNNVGNYRGFRIQQLSQYLGPMKPFKYGIPEVQPNTVRLKSLSIRRASGGGAGITNAETVYLHVYSAREPSVAAFVGSSSNTHNFNTNQLEATLSYNFSGMSLNMNQEYFFYFSTIPTAMSGSSPSQVRSGRLSVSNISAHTFDGSLISASSFNNDGAAFRPVILIELAQVSEINQPQEAAFLTLEQITKLNKLAGDNPAPNEITSDGFKGDVRYDEYYLYLCITDNNWRRIPLELF